jgi:hypothetical protein
MCTEFTGALVWPVNPRQDVLADHPAPSVALRPMPKSTSKNHLEMTGKLSRLLLHNIPTAVDGY